MKTHQNFFRSLLVLGSACLLIAVTFFQGRVDWSETAYAQKSSGAIWSEKSESEKNSSGGGFDIAALNRGFVDLAKKMSPSVVNIYTKTRVVGGPQAWQGGRGPGPGPGQLSPEDMFRYFFGNPFDNFQMPPREAQSLGSGFVINTDGTIITNSHVVRMDGKNADSIMVKFNNESEKSQGHEAKVLGVDETTDVAVLKLKAPKKDLTVAPLGNSDKTQVGEWVVAIGNPYGHAHSVTKGIVSALGRALESSRSDFIQTDASINPGNSGGPLFNLYGEVIGINTAIDARAQGIGFAIPINVAKNVVKQIIEKGEVSLGWVGVTIAEVSPEIARSLGISGTEGVMIQDVFQGEPADRAGLRSYDVVVEINGKKISTGREFIMAVGNSSVGQVVNIKLLREGKSLIVPVKVGKRKSETELAKKFGSQSQSPGPTKKSSSGKSGMLLAELTPELRRELDVNGVKGGVVITQIQSGSPAQAAMLSPGDVLVEIDRKAISNVKEAVKLLSTKKDSFLLKVQRRRASIIVFMDMNAVGDGESEAPFDDQRDDQ